MKYFTSIMLGAIIGCILVAVLVALQGCGGAQPAPAAPGVIQTAEDCWACGKCAKDLVERYAATKADAGRD